MGDFDPTGLIMALASAAASAYQQNQAERKVVAARNAVTQQQMQALTTARNNAAGSFQASNFAASPAAMQANMAADEAQKAALYESGVNRGEMLPGDTSEAVKQSIVGSLAKGANFSKDVADKRAAYDAFGNASFNRDVNMQHAGQDIAMQGNFASGNAMLAPGQYAQANLAGFPNSRLSGLIQGAGAVTGAAYAKGKAATAQKPWYS